jgi:hypothetical protein
MDKATRKELIAIITKQEEDLNRYRTRLQGNILSVVNLLDIFLVPSNFYHLTILRLFSVIPDVLIVIIYLPLLC